MDRLLAFDYYSSDKNAKTVLNDIRARLESSDGKRPVLAVSSTSWTLDEDFSILFNSIDVLEEELRKETKNSRFPQVLLFITGKGPLQKFYQEEIAKKSENWSHFHVMMGWLSWSDYPLLLGCADFGVSLHSSSSGLDFPMKIIDMIASGLPVVSLDFPSSQEILKGNAHSRTFTNESELLGILSSIILNVAPIRASSIEKTGIFTLNPSQYWNSIIKEYI